MNAIISTGRAKDSEEKMLAISEVSKQFDLPSGGRLNVIEKMTISVRQGSFASIIGKSGCGKTTLFNIIAGLARPTSGSVSIDGRDITGKAGLVAYMLQKDLLLPWRTVLDNVILGLELQGVKKSQAKERALPLLRKYGLGGFEESYPASLSGGMRQRAALLRTLLCDSDVILLDEPFAALDAQTRFAMQQWLLQIWEDFGKTILFVTHDVEEAVFLSDEIYILAARPGRVADHFTVDLPRPRNRSILSEPEFVATKERCLTYLFDENSTI